MVLSFRISFWIGFCGRLGLGVSGVKERVGDGWIDEGRFEVELV